MKIGIFGGGFKPLTTGHFSLIALALKENDKVILCYGLSKRKKGSEFVYTEDMASKIYEINRVALKREFGDKIEIIKGKPTPLTKIFQIIRSIKSVIDNEQVLPEDAELISRLSIDPKNVTRLTVYALPEELAVYTMYINNPEKKAKYYGTLYDNGILKFRHGLVEDDKKELSDISNYIQALKSHYPDVDEKDIYDKARMRGTKFRQLIANKDLDMLDKYLPPFLNKDEKKSIIDILVSSVVDNMQEELLRSFIKGFIRG